MMRRNLISLSLVALALMTQGSFANKKQKSKTDGVELRELDYQSSVQIVLQNKSFITHFGAVVANAHDFQANRLETPDGPQEVTERLQVLAVASDSQAAKLGLQPGDVLMEIDGHYVPKGETAETQLTRDILPKVDWNKPVEAMVLRDGYAQTLKAAQP